MAKLFSNIDLGAMTLQNRIVMAPMTRCRATDNVPNELMKEYYSQRSSAGLIVTEGTGISPDAMGYARIPGIYTREQVQGWKSITQSVHKGGAKIFLQLMHTGRIAHSLNLPEGGRVLAPSAIAAKESVYTDSEGMKELPVPTEMTKDDIQCALQDFTEAAKNAMSAGFDGVELHAANGYLIEQFIRPTSNKRQDGYGGSIENRSRFLMEAVKLVAGAIGPDRVGIRLSPYGVFNDMPLYEDMEADYEYIAKALGQVAGLAYVHLVDHSAMGAPQVPATIKEKFRALFRGKLILSGGYIAQSAEADIAIGNADLIAVGRPFLANPDLPARWREAAELNNPDYETFYTPGVKGYTDYPVMA